MSQHIEGAPMNAEHCAYCEGEFPSPFVHAIVDLRDGMGGRPTCVDCIPGMFKRHGSCVVLGFAIWVRNDEKDLDAIERAGVVLKAMVQHFQPPTET